MAAQFGRRLYKGATTTAVAAVAVAALSASGAPGATLATGSGDQQSAGTTPSPDDTAATGNSPYYTDLPPLNTPNKPGTATDLPITGSAESGIPASILAAYKKAEQTVAAATPPVDCRGNCSPRSARSSPARPAAAGSTRTEPRSPRSSARSSTAGASP